MARDVLVYIQTISSRAYASPVIDIYIELAQAQLASDAFGDLYNYAVALKALHDWTIDTDRQFGESGLITDRTEGRLTLRYLHNMNKESKTDLLMTSYGQKLHSLIRRCVGPVARTVPVMIGYEEIGYVP